MCPGASIQCCFSSLCVIFHSVFLRRRVTKQITSKQFQWSTQEPTIPVRAEHSITAYDPSDHWEEPSLAGCWIIGGAYFMQVLILVVDNRKRQNSEGGNSWSFCRADLTVASFQTGLEDPES